MSDWETEEKLYMENTEKYFTELQNELDQQRASQQLRDAAAMENLELTKPVFRVRRNYQEKSLRGFDQPMPPKVPKKQKKAFQKRQEAETH